MTLDPVGKNKYISNLLMCPLDVFTDYLDENEQEAEWERLARTYRTEVVTSLRSYPQNPGDLSLINREYASILIDAMVATARNSTQNNILDRDTLLSTVSTHEKAKVAAESNKLEYINELCSSLIKEHSVLAINFPSSQNLASLARDSVLKQYKISK